MKKNNGFFLFVMFFASFFLPLTSNAQVIFSENYDSITDWNSGNPTPTGWTGQAGVASHTWGGVTHYAGEIKSPGRGGTGKSLKLWRQKVSRAIYIKYVGAETTATAFVRTKSTDSPQRIELAAPAGTVVYTIDVHEGGSYDTLTKVVNYIDGLADWEASLGAGLAGSELSCILSPSLVAVDVKPGTWFQWDFSPGFNGYLNKTFTQAEFDNHYKELYQRWYVKWDSNWNVLTGDYEKFNRAEAGSTQGSSTFTWYFNALWGATLKDCVLGFYITSDTTGWKYTSQTVLQLGILDGNWHCFEVHLKLNSQTGVADGELHFWIDGVQKISVTNKDWGTLTNTYFTVPLTPGIGNFGGGRWNFLDDNWYAIEFDDFVLSTTYIGPAGIGPAGDSTPPSRPQGVKIVQ